MAFSPSVLASPARLPFLLTALACVLALSGALIAEHGFGLAPCVLCLAARVPFVLAGAVALFMLLLPTSTRLRVLGLSLITLAFAANVAIAAYHVGVEEYWWTSAVCDAADAPAALGSLGDLRAALDRPSRPACDVVQWRLFGISLAGYNLAYCLVLTVGGGLFLRRAVAALPPAGRRSA